MHGFAKVKYMQFAHLASTPLNASSSLHGEAVDLILTSGVDNRHTVCQFVSQFVSFEPSNCGETFVASSRLLVGARSYHDDHNPLGPGSKVKVGQWPVPLKDGSDG